MRIYTVKICRFKRKGDGIDGEPDAIIKLVTWPFCQIDIKSSQGAIPST